MNSCSASIVPMTTANRITGLIDGSVTQRNRCHGPAPSSAADSYRCFGTSTSAARKMIIVLPMPHSSSSVSAGLDQPATLNHSGPSIPISPSAPLTGPVAGLSR